MIVRPIKLLALCLTLAVAHVHMAAAQVNTEALRMGEPPEGLYGNLGLDLSLKHGAVEYLEVTGQGLLGYHAHVHTLLLSANAGYGNTGGERFAQRMFAHGRWTAAWATWVHSELFAQLEYDRFLRQLFRGVLGAGPRFGLLQESSGRAFLGLAYMLERESLDIPAADPHPPRSINHRLSSYLTLQWEPLESVKMTQTLYVQPRLDDLADIRVLEQLDLQVNITDALAIRTSFTLRHDGRPPQGVPKTNIDLSQGLTYKFQ